MYKKKMNRPPIIPMEERRAKFEKVRADCRLVGTCWICDYAPNSSGYPVMDFHGRRFVVSRFMLAVATAESYSFDYEACHNEECTNRRCCNPAHMHWGDDSLNAAEREYMKAKRTLQGMTTSVPRLTKSEKVVIRRGSRRISAKNTETHVFEPLEPPIEA